MSLGGVEILVVARRLISMLDIGLSAASEKS